MNQFWIGFLGTYPPRKCGIATFTRDLSTALISKYSPCLSSKIIAMKKKFDYKRYPNNIIYPIIDENLKSYKLSAKKLNSIEKLKIINIQHEFGIFGGDYGEYLIEFLETIQKPVVTTLHTIIPKPGQKMRKILKDISELSTKLVIMNNLGINILRNDYKINKDKIVVIPHGTPTIPFNEGQKFKDFMGFKNKIILASFGMMNSSKGYEYIIESLPPLIKEYPNLLYLIIGATHPLIKKTEGEKYRNFLKDKINQLNLQNNIKFINKYLNLEEIIRYLQVTDIFLSANQDPYQITSGTLAYAASSGKAIISTPYYHAKDLLTPERGILVNFKDSFAFTKAIKKLISNPEFKKTLEYNLYSHTRNSTWPNVAIAYFNIFKEFVPELNKCRFSLPTIRLKHLKKLTNDFGMIQFSNFAIPDIESGYSCDDNARALIVSANYYQKFENKDILNLIRIYLNFIEFISFDSRFYNFVTKKGKINLLDWSEDTHGRTLWALGYLQSIEKLPDQLKSKALELFNKGISIIDTFKSPRAIAFAIIGLYYSQQTTKIDIDLIKKLSDYLVKNYEEHAKGEWKWFENYLTYANSKLSEALFYSYKLTNNKKYLKIANQSLEFLINQTFINGFYAPIGQDGWYQKAGKRALYDQQPINTSSMVQTLVQAYKVTKKKDYTKFALKAFEWFLGRNTLEQIVYDDSFGGSYDGLEKDKVNLNQGAESTVCYLMARLSIEKIKNEIS
ncbi:MAG: glycosyltransferase [Candidatus Lokiarchaeota archaeon]|nr:glycosyltransferase [Candidatus Lokiarchaeota archaeon]